MNREDILTGGLHDSRASIMIPGEFIESQLCAIQSPPPIHLIYILMDLHLLLLLDFLSVQHRK